MREEFRASIYGLLDFYRRYENAEGLLECLPSWNFVEWSKANDWTKDVNYPTNFLYAQVLDAIANLYGDETCRRRAGEVRKAAVAQSFNGHHFRDHAVRNGDGSYTVLDDTTEICQYYAVLFAGIEMDAEEYAELKDLILHVFKPDREGVLPEIIEINAFIGVYLRMEVLLKLKAYELELENIAGFFGQMEAYTGTLWENRQAAGSFNHGFASYALVAMKRSLEGLGK
jgi:alpha-L-rhamnosidase